jgi:DNA-binding transcriptional regulator GbsR (MarR family)
MLTLTSESAKELIASGKEAITRMQAQIDSGINFHLQTRIKEYENHIHMLEDWLSEQAHD